MLFEKIKNAIFPEEQQELSNLEAEPIEAELGATLAEVQSSLADMSPSKIETVFEEMPHETRIEFVYHRAITRKCWREFYLYVGDTHVEKWGLTSRCIKVGRGGTRQCIMHDSIAEPRVLKRRSEQSEMKSHSRSEGTKGEVTGDAQVVKGSIEGTETDTEERSSNRADEHSSKRTIWECATLDKYCQANRRAFIKAGEYYIGGGPVREAELEREFERVVEQSLGDEDGEQAENP